MTEYRLAALLMLCIVCVLVGVWIGLERFNRSLIEANRERESLARYRRAVDDLDRWCGYFYPEAKLIAAHIDAIGEGKGVNAGSPAGLEPCTIAGLREQLGRLKALCNG